MVPTQSVTTRGSFIGISSISPPLKKLTHSFVTRNASCVTTASVSIRQHMSASVSIRQHASEPKKGDTLIRHDHCFVRNCDRRSCVSICTFVPVKQVNSVPLRVPDSCVEPLPSEEEEEEENESSEPVGPLTPNFLLPPPPSERDTPHSPAFRCEALRITETVTGSSSGVSICTFVLVKRVK
jgi:hypothetical protein